MPQIPTPLTPQSVFDRVLVDFFLIEFNLNIYVANGPAVYTRGLATHPDKTQISGGFQVPLDDPSVIEILRRINAGTCNIEIGQRHHSGDTWIAYADWPTNLMAFQLLHPFHPPGSHAKGLFELFDNLTHQAAAGMTPGSVTSALALKHAGQLAAAERTKLDALLAGLTVTPNELTGETALSFGTMRGEMTAAREVTDQDYLHRAAAAYDTWKQATATIPEAGAAYVTLREYWERLIGYAWYVVGLENYSLTYYPGPDHQAPGDGTILTQSLAADFLVDYIDPWREEFADLPTHASLPQTALAMQLTSRQLLMLGHPLAAAELTAAIEQSVWDALQTTHYAAALAYDPVTQS